MNQQFANIALSLIDQVRGPYDDQSLQAVMQTKQWLRQIENGQLLVQPPKQEPAK